jgi:hypothetical protein
MRILWKILGIIVVVLLIFTFLPVSVFGEERVDVEVSARINQQKLQFWNPYTIDNVNYQVIGDTNYIEWDNLFGIFWETGDVEFCIDLICQKNTETFFISPGEQKTTSEVLHGITRGSHTLKITFTVDGTIEDTYTESITI